MLTSAGGRAAEIVAPVRVTLVAPGPPGAPHARRAGRRRGRRVLARDAGAGADRRGRRAGRGAHAGDARGDAGQLLADDLDPTTAGTQVALEGGFATVDLAGQGTPGTADVTARTAAGLEATARVSFVPDLRPPLAVGSLEGIVALSGYPGGRAPDEVLPRPLFEAKPVAFVSESADGDALAAIRGSAFYKGRVKDDILLTLGYDSERAPHVRAFRDLQPDAYYPLYGDASVRGFEAQSTRPLYARVDRRGASVMYGDFVTPGYGGGRTLGGYSRSLNGVRRILRGRARALRRLVQPRARRRARSTSCAAAASRARTR